MPGLAFPEVRIPGKISATSPVFFVAYSIIESLISFLFPGEPSKKNEF